jgi:hypothetical protein
MLIYFIGVVLLYIWIIKPLGDFIHHKYGFVGDIWMDRVMYISGLCAGLYLDWHITYLVLMSIAVAWNMLIYNPFTLPAVLAKREEMRKIGEGLDR